MTDPDQPADQPADQPDDGVAYAETFAIASAVATHPEGTPLDVNGDPIPPDQGE